MQRTNFDVDHPYAFSKEGNHGNKGSLCTKSDSLLNLLSARTLSGSFTALGLSLSILVVVKAVLESNVGDAKSVSPGLEKASWLYRERDMISNITPLP